MDRGCVNRTFSLGLVGNRKIHAAPGNGSTSSRLYSVTRDRAVPCRLLLSSRRAVTKATPSQV